MPGTSLKATVTDKSIERHSSYGGVFRFKCSSV